MSRSTNTESTDVLVERREEYLATLSQDEGPACAKQGIYSGVCKPPYEPCHPRCDRMWATRKGTPFSSGLGYEAETIQSYSKYALAAPEQCKVVAIAEPRPHTRRNFARIHSVDQTLVFETWQELHAASAETIKTIGTRLADAVIIAVHDHMHAAVVQAFAEQGYHILCEKPLATSISDCLAIEAAVKKANIVFGVCHGDCPPLAILFLLNSNLRSIVLRYSPYGRAITEIVQSGSLGQLVNIVQVEPVGYYHFAHSYVRGNWANEAASSFSLMTKCCQCVTSCVRYTHLT